MSLNKELKEIKQTIHKLKLNDFESLATYILNYSDWLKKMSKCSIFAKYAQKRLHETIPKDFIDFDDNSKCY